MNEEPETPASGRVERNASGTQRSIIRRTIPAFGDSHIEHIEPDPEDLERVAEQVRDGTAAVYPNEEQ